MIVIWSRLARHDLRAIEAYVLERNPVAASILAAEIIEAGESLAVFSNRGRRSSLADLRELKVPRRPYFLVYRTSGRSIDVLRVIHTSRRWPPLLEDSE